LPHLLKNKSSALVNNSSSAVIHPHPWLAAYSASKGAIKSFTQSLYVEYSLQGLRANCVLPGRIETGLARNFSIPEGANPELLKILVPLGRVNLVAPDKVAGVVAFLLSDDALHINGTEILVDGGQIT
jgi:NAD(P)-dependent dehydrogenase (short-subunit alcohol dehydrogenase family)